MDMVNQGDDCKFYIVKDLPEDTKRAGRATVKAFGVKSRFVHFEFFRLRQDQKGLGRRGEIMARSICVPAAAHQYDMMDRANSTDNVPQNLGGYGAFDRSQKPEGARMRSAPMSAEGMASSISSANEEISRYEGDAVVCPVARPDALEVLPVAISSIWQPSTKWRR